AEALEARLRARWPDCLVISAKREPDVKRVRVALLAFFARDLVEVELHLGWDRQALRAAIFDQCEVLGERSDETGTIFQVREDAEDLHRQRRDEAARDHRAAGMDPARRQQAPPEELAVDAREQAADDAGAGVARDRADGVVELEAMLHEAQRERELRARAQA